MIDVSKIAFNRPSCTVFFITAPLTNDSFTQTKGNWGSGFAIVGDTRGYQYDSFWLGCWGQSRCSTYLAVCVLQHGILSYKLWLPPPLPSNDVKDLRKCVSFGSMNVIWVYRCDLWILYECIILICNVIFVYPFVLWMLYMNMYHFGLWISFVCIIRSMNVISPVCFVFHSLMDYMAINTFSL